MLPQQMPESWVAEGVAPSQPAHQSTNKRKQNRIAATEPRIPMSRIDLGRIDAEPGHDAPGGVAFGLPLCDAWMAVAPLGHQRSDTKTGFE